MTRSPKPLQIVVYQDVLCAWCYVADARFEVLRAEFGHDVQWRTRPYPLRIQEALPSEKEVSDWLAELERAKKEPEGARLTPELWTAGDPPRSSVNALAALEAAKLQGQEAQTLLARAMQRAALEQGVNVTRRDVVFELASRVGLEMNRFCTVYDSGQTKRLILEEHRLAADRGVRGVPTLVLGGRWMVSGLREVSEYRELIRDCLTKQTLAAPKVADRILH
jgi:predicted DsbA family dithiol-disulfide isomerase